jgi:hypothetical protein
MTDIKPYARDDDPEPIDRSVAVILVVSAANAANEPGLLQPMRSGTTLWDLALTCLERLDEPDELAVWAEDTALLEHFEGRAHPRARLLAAPPELALVRGERHALRSANVAILDGRHPFLRPSTIDEAVRLFRMRPDLPALASCVRASGRLFDLHGNELVSPAPVESERVYLRQVHAFSIVPAESISMGKRVTPAPFEISATEAFRADGPFPFQLASCYVATSEP